MSRPNATAEMYRLLAAQTRRLTELARLHRRLDQLEAAQAAVRSSLAQQDP